MTAKIITAALIAVSSLAALPSLAASQGVDEVGYIAPISTSSSGLTREAVRAEYLEARRNGTLPQTGEAADAGVVIPTTSTLTRAAVHADAVEAVRRGLHIPGEL
jgi:hypothetical protein